MMNNNPFFQGGIVDVRASAAAREVSLSPWAVRKDALSESIQMVQSIRQGDRSVGAENSQVQANRRGVRLANNTFATRVGDTAVIPVLGPLMSRYSWFFWSYDEVVRDLRMAAGMHDIKAIVLDIDSPGGTVANAQSVPREIARIRSEDGKPVVAHIGGIGASAAYWLASAADQVIADRTGLVGSVGALIRYLDIEGIFTKMGAKVVEVIAEQSPNKRLDPDSEAGRAELQAIVDDAGEMFIEALVENRGVDRETIMDRYGQGLVFAAGEALERGLIDSIGSFEEVLTDLADRQENSAAVSAAAQADERTIDMVDKTGKKDGADANTAAALNVETLKSENPDLVKSIEDGAAQRAAKAERERIAGIDKHAQGLTGVDELVAEMKADGAVTPAMAAERLLEASKAKIGEQLKGLDQLDNAAKGVDSSPSATGDGGTSVKADTPDGWKAEWENTPKLQETYPTADAYVATRKRDAMKAA